MARVAVVEDDPTTALMVRATFEGAGHQVQVIPKPERALASLMEAPPDALVLDIVMPGTSGWEILRAIRAEPATANLPILLLSSLDGSNHRIQGLRGGASDYLTKPFDPDELLLRVERMLKNAAVSNADLEGNLENFPFWELLQSLQQGRRSGLLELRGAVAGFLELRRGAVVVAQQGKLEGKEAVLALSEATGGRFVFLPVDATEELVGHETIFVHHLIMTAALLEDELNKRRSFLPPSDQPLWAVPGKLPSPPEALQEVPFDQLHQYLVSAPGATWEKIQEEEFAAPQKISLGLAWLHEQARVQLEQVVPAKTLPKKSKPIHQLVLCQREAWEQLRQRLEASAEDIDSEQLNSLLEQLTLRRAGTAQMRRGEVDIHLHILMLKQDSVARALAILPLCSCVVLWLAGENAMEKASPIFRGVEQQRRGAKGVLIAPTESTFRAARQGTVDSSRWSVTSAIPPNLGKLMDFAL